MLRNFHFRNDRIEMYFLSAARWTRNKVARSHLCSHIFWNARRATLCARVWNFIQVFFRYFWRDVVPTRSNYAGAIGVLILVVVFVFVVLVLALVVCPVLLQGPFACFED